MSDGEEFKIHEPDEDVAREHLDMLESVIGDAEGGYLSEGSLKGAALRASAATAHSLYEIKALMLSMVMCLEKIASRPVPPLMEVPQFEIQEFEGQLLSAAPWRDDAEWVDKLAESIAAKLGPAVRVAVPPAGTDDRFSDRVARSYDGDSIHHDI